MRGYLTRSYGTIDRLIVTSCVVVISVAGCVRGGPPTRSPVAAPVEAPATVVVRNHHEADLRLYVMVADGKSHRLGLVPKFGAATLALPRGIRLPAVLSFAAIPLSDAEPQVTGPIDVDAGTRLVFTVAHAASLSTLSKLP